MKTQRQLVTNQLTGFTAQAGQPFELEHDVHVEPALVLAHVLLHELVPVQVEVAEVKFNLAHQLLVEQSISLSCLLFLSSHDDMCVFTIIL